MDTSIETYVALNNPKALANVLEEMGAPKVTSTEDLLRKVHYATSKFGIKAFEKIASIDTPYRTLILSETLAEPKCSSCSNCSPKLNFEGPAIMPASTTTLAPAPMNPNNPNDKLIIVSLALLGVIAVIALVK